MLRERDERVQRQSLRARHQRGANAVEEFTIREALHLVNEGGFTGEVVVNNAFAEPEFLADLCKCRRAESAS